MAEAAAPGSTLLALTPADLPATRSGVAFSFYQSELQLGSMMELFAKDLSEPYSVFTYRYFLHQWPQLCVLAHVDDKLVGSIVCKASRRKNERMRGYVAMLAVDKTCRRGGIGASWVPAR